MKCDHCEYEWVAVSPIEARELECSQCGKMTTVYPATATAYATATLRFIYIEGGKPEPGTAVLGAWTNGDEFHVTLSVWDSDKQQWLDHDGSFALDVNYQLYAWAEWPAAPPL